jgi:hypothetical protein
MSDLLDYSRQLDELLPTFEHHEQICYFCSTADQFNIIEKFTTLIDIQYYMFNMNITIERIKSAINDKKHWLFYIAPNTYTNSLTLKQFFRCINDDFSEYKIRTKELTYKYNLFYSGKKFKGNILDHLGEFIDGVSPHRPPIDIGYLKCYRRDIIKGSTTDMDFKKLPMKDFHTWLKILELPFSEKSKAYNEYKTEFTKEWHDYQKINKKTVQFSNQNTKKTTPPQLNKLASSQTKKEDAIPVKHHQDNILEDALNQIKNLKEEIESLERMHATECISYAETIETLQKKCIELENTNVALVETCTALEISNAKLVERTKILDESNF